MFPNSVVKKSLISPALYLGAISGNAYRYILHAGTRRDCTGVSLCKRPGCYYHTRHRYAVVGASMPPLKCIARSVANKINSPPSEPLLKFHKQLNRRCLPCFPRPVPTVDGRLTLVGTYTYSRTGLSAPIVYHQGVFCWYKAAVKARLLQKPGTGKRREDMTRLTEERRDLSLD